VASLTNEVVTSENIEYHIRILTQYFLRREQIRIGYESMQAGYDEMRDVFETQDEINSNLTKLNQYIIGKDYESELSEEIENSFEFITKKRETQITGLSTGSPKLNEITAGWQAGDFIIICARPSHGKTTRLLQYLLSAAMNEKRVAFFSIEMNKLKIHTKLISHLSEVTGDCIKFQTWNERELENLKAAKERIKQLPIYINDKAVVTANYIRAVARERQKKYGLDLIAVDYLQLMRPNNVFHGQKEEQKISDISLSLKTLAKDMNVPIIALSQLSRECEGRQNKRPILSDLRYSGQLEQDADVVLSQYIPSKYYKLEKDPDYKHEEIFMGDYTRISETGILKNRMGESGTTIKEYFYGEYSRYYFNKKEDEL